MNAKSRIPKLNSLSFDGALVWFAEMAQQGLLFHPDDDPADLTRISDEERLFSGSEVSEVRFLIGELFTSLGDEVYDAAYPIVMKAFGQHLDA